MIRNNTISPAEADLAWMRIAIDKAVEAESRGEVPVGAVVVVRQQIAGSAGNNPISGHDPTAHAEILALREAARTMSNYRLVGATLYVTLEPCIMCMGAIIQARIGRLVYGADDPKSGAAGSVYSIGQDGLLNHRLEIRKGVLAPQCSQLLQDFFRRKRRKDES